MNQLTKGIIYVALGASSFGMLASFVKLAYKSGYTTAEVTLSQFALGIIFVALLVNFTKKTAATIATAKDKKNLMLAGTTMGLTSILYYLCVKYINASVAVVLLMQSVWIGVVVEMVQTKRFPSFQKIIAVIIILIGTALATNILAENVSFNALGLLFGVLAACSFSTTIYSSNSIATHLHPFKRSLFMLLGGGIMVLIFAFITQVGPTYLNFNILGSSDIATVKPIDFNIFITYGIILSLFGTVLPPIFLNKGFPLTGVGLGSIVSALELPVSVTFAYFMLSEVVIGTQWLGILFILLAIVLMNIQFKK
ncbi:DMT family transporter [Flavobacterium agricola]|uniref:DMT family transporter n=1 Tax=Flavobacterium agricola TaxID=2870839 RepID=A0ABY6M1J9_9FLAO|nr:DMT family transporter [Flavobacterium agricola]UYW01590.1 DMT family transporter [Flavobacterium agricola]